ncbi:energy-coupling factor transporter transmembrane component T family protein [Kiritimatiella glycovorans]|uniref:Cobalt ABC transporter, permease protein CbiQ n=1 Tax=Kiritimatiella glycovorans TaxID=1307763 RepID=A0A0G3EFK9_9BACT|nr:energy-coupling factor transporter transmembrane component T [Kiritimatiella glycovorans]AKJ65133.1 cobalt ABC transporter, permease protein CbiQ [Kiritimatiella glycovorans]
MSCITPWHRPPRLSGIDPRLRLGAAAAFAVTAAVCDSTLAPAVMLSFFVLLALAEQFPLPSLMRRLLPLNVFLLFVSLTVVFSGAGGAATVAEIYIKGNAIMLNIVLLMGSMDIFTLAHALQHCHVSPKAVQVLLFSSRYLELIQHREYNRIYDAMRSRGFRPALNLHTLRCYGMLTGQLLIRGHDRAEHILQAMRCRGFNGVFHPLDDLEFRRRDLYAALTAAALFITLVLLETGVTP